LGPIRLLPGRKPAHSSATCTGVCPPYDLKEIAEVLHESEPALIVLGEATIERAVEEATERAKKQTKKEVRAQAKEIEKAIDEA
jgi:hypothetical protein